MKLFPLAAAAVTTVAATIAFAAESSDKANAPERFEAQSVLTDALQAVQGKSPQEAEPALRLAAKKAADMLGDDWNAAAKFGQIAKLDDAEELKRRFEVARTHLVFVPLGEAETPPNWPTYTVVGEVEVKQYPTYRVAIADTASMRGADNRLFWTLFNHIKDNDIPMTAPVEMTREPAGQTMGFLYPDSDIGSIGTQGDVEVIDIEPQRVVSIGMLGGSRSSEIQNAEKQLRSWIAGQDIYEADGPMRILGYNGPMVPRMMSYSEIQIPLRAAGDDQQPADDTADIVEDVRP